MVTTAHLSLRPLRDEDLPALYGIQSNCEAMRFTYYAPSLEECSRRLRAHEGSRVLVGFAPWVVLERSESKVIGWGGVG